MKNSAIDFRSGAGSEARVAFPSSTLKPLSSDEVLIVLRQLRRRLVVQWFLEAMIVGGLVTGAATTLVLAWHYFALPGRLMSGWWPAAFALASSAVVTLRMRAVFPSLKRVAVRVDALGDTKDRLLNALVFAQAGAALSPIQTLAQRECAEYLGRRDFQPLLPIKLPRFSAWLFVPLLAAAMLYWQSSITQAGLLAETEEAQRIIASTAEQIENMANKARQAADQPRSDDLKKLAEQLQKSVERLRAETKSEEAQKAGLREISALEQMMRELQRQPSPVDEMKEMAKALASLPGMQDVLNALNEDNLAEAQRALDRAMEEKADQKPDQLTEEQAEKQLQQAIQRMGDQRRLSEALQRFAEQMKKQAGGGMTRQAMQQLQQMMQQMSRDGQKSDGNSGDQQRQMTLQEMIAALENMKFGDGQGLANQGSNSQQIPNGPQIAMQSFGSTNPQGQPQLGNANQPSGRAGSEKDFGTTDTPFGQQSEAQDKGGELTLKGQLGQGETLSMIRPSAGDQSQSARRYKDLYEAAASSAQDAVEQENIPLGSRFLIKRYFELIRPGE